MSGATMARTMKYDDGGSDRELLGSGSIRISSPRGTLSSERRLYREGDFRDLRCNLKINKKDVPIYWTVQPARVFARPLGLDAAVDIECVETAFTHEVGSLPVRPSEQSRSGIHMLVRASVMHTKSLSFLAVDEAADDELTALARLLEGEPVLIDLDL